MVKIEITFGVGEDKHRRPIENLSKKLPEIESAAAKAFGGYTILVGVGGWYNGKEIVQEPSETLVIVSERSVGSVFEEARSLRDFIRETLNQAAVVLTITNLNVLEIK